MTLKFTLKATELGLGVVRLYVSQEGQSLGSSDLESEIVAAEEVAAEQIQTSNLQHPLPEVQILPPDLSLLIWQARMGGELHLLFELRTREGAGGPKIQQEFGPVKLVQEPREYFQNFFRDIDQHWSDIEDFLGVNGSALFMELFPERLRKLLWELRDRIHSVQVQSEDPWIPWELCKLQGWKNNVLEEGSFFCEQFALTRWIPQLTSKPELRLNRMAVVVPKDTGLKHADSEREYLLKLINGREVKSIPATRKEVIEALASGQFDAWHFTCHGQFDPASNQAVLQLEGADTLGPELLSSAKIQRVGLTQPFVFLNACQTGQASASLSGPAGWADRFLKAAYGEEHRGNGAAAFIGAFWSIDDEAAHEFAKMLYDGLLKEGKTIGDAVLEARGAIRGRGDGSWLAYTVFAHPLAKVK